ncbi:hypothetical protein V8B97DRAFT_2022404 [Scleroderma yunnanense]
MSSETLNDILFEVTGVGKSSVINLTARSPMAQTSTGYQFKVGSRRINIRDIAGLEEPWMGPVVSILFCVLPGRIIATTQRNYRLSYDILCNNCAWSIGWKIGGNENAILKRGLQSAGHACVSGIERDAHKYSESIDALLHLLSQHDNRGRFSMPPKPWFPSFLKSMLVRKSHTSRLNNGLDLG